MKTRQGGLTVNAERLRASLYRYGLAILLILVALNVWLVFRVNSIMVRVMQLPTHISSSGGSTRVDLSKLYTGVESMEYVLLSEELASTLDVGVKFRLTEKLPGSKVYVQYREADESPWVKVLAAAVEGLHYQAALKLDPAKSYEYQVVQLAANETLRESVITAMNLPDAVGSSDVQISMRPYMEHLVRVQAHQRTKMSSWQVERVTFALDNSWGEASAVVNWNWGEGWGAHDYPKKLVDKTKVMTVTAYYKDGETQSIEFDPSIERNVVIKRNP